jgi:hypothetical protein
MDERDAMIDRVVESLRPLPEVDDSAKARLLIAVAAERERDRERAMRRLAPGRISPWIIRGTGVAAAAALIGAILLSNTHETVAPVRTAAVPPPPSAADVHLVGSDASTGADAARHSVELVFRAPAASTVRVVGDFNGWDQSLAPMQRDAASGLWSVTLSLKAGRHVYAFVVDDTLWMRDPRAPTAKDADFGRPGSVLLVGRP